jgi:hypothetical protein
VLRHGDVKVVDVIICSQKRRETVKFTRQSFIGGPLINSHLFTPMDEEEALILQSDQANSTSSRIRAF